MQARLYITLIAAILVGCSNAATPIRLENGTLGYQAFCPTEITDWGGCRKIAGDTCGTRGYEIVAQDEYHKEGGRGLIGLLFPAPDIVSRTMTFRCKGA